MDKRSYTSPEPRRQTYGPLIIVFAIIVLLPAVVTVLVVSWKSRTEGPGMREQVQTTARSVTPGTGLRDAAEPEDGDVRRVRGANTTRSRMAHPSAGPPSSEIQFPSRTVADFPTDSNIPVGTTRSQLLARFGKPNMITVSVEAGRSRETLVYLRRDTDSQTAVQVRGGRVVGVIVSVY